MPRSSREGRPSGPGVQLPWPPAPQPSPAGSCGLGAPRAPVCVLDRLLLRLPARTRRRRPRRCCGCIRERRVDHRLQRSLGSMVELTLQQVVESSGVLIQATSFTYWLSQFAVVGIALTWVYFKAHERFYGFRNTLIVGNLIGLVGYVLLPTAPPRMFPEAGSRTRSPPTRPSTTHPRSLPSRRTRTRCASLHALDALIVSVVMATVVRRWWAKALWLAWAPWVWFAVMATGNHFWLDIAAGVLVAGVAAAIVSAVAAAPRAPSMSLKEAYTGGARAIASRSMTGLARTRVTPNMLTAAGVTLRGRRRPRLLRVPERLVLLLRRARVRDRLHPRHPRRRPRPRRRQADALGGFPDSTLDRVGEGLVLGAMRSCSCATARSSRSRSRSRSADRFVPTPARRRKARDQGRCRNRLARRAGGGDRRRSRARAVGRAALGDRPARRDGVVHGAPADPVRPPRACAR